MVRYGFFIFFLQNVNCMNYWDNKKIHYLGNTGVGGKIHSTLAPLFNSVLEYKVYSGEDVRYNSINSLKNKYENICDFCCGVGISTNACFEVYPDANIIGIDTSKEMLDTAFTRTNKKIKYINSNAENFTCKENFDLITLMFALHEIPKKGRHKILNNIKSILKPGGTLLILDISPDYKITQMMEGGEPYVREYVSQIDNDIQCLFTNYKKTDIVDDHLTQWTITM